jgi:hypothetical protein
MDGTAFGSDFGKTYDRNHRSGSQDDFAPRTRPTVLAIFSRKRNKALPDSSISIGTIDLQDFEVPSSVRFGGRQRLTVHRLSDGRRIVESLGPDDGEISFHGTASGADADSRIRGINRLRLSGEAVWLAWESFRYRVVIKSLVMEYQSPWWIPFRVSCVIVDQEGTNASAGSALWAMISADLGSAMSAAGDQSSGLGALQVALSGINVMTAGTLDRAQAVNSVAATLAPIGRQISQASAALISPGERSGGYSSVFAARVASAGSLATAVNVSAYVGRIGTLLGQVG